MNPIKVLKDSLPSLTLTLQHILSHLEEQTSLQKETLKVTKEIRDQHESLQGEKD